MKKFTFRNPVLVVTAASLSIFPELHGQDVLRNLAEMMVTAESEADETDQHGWLPAVSGASIFSGKKTAVIDLDGQARIIGNNYRQALSQTPSLLLSEESSPLVSIGYRGLNPNRTQFTQVLKDGIPIHAEQFGYPEAYYTPPLDTVDRIEFLHGGAALQYGPQAGGALNYITHRPRTDQPFSLRTQHIVGSDDLYSTFTSADGTVGQLGYYLYYNHRQADGFRSVNSDYDLSSAAIKLLYSLDNGGKVIFRADTYDENHGEPGGLTVADFNAGSLKSSRELDRFSLDRDSVSLTYEIAPDPESFFTATAWWTDYTRYSERQRGGGFGILPSGLTSGTNGIEDQNFKTLGLDGRYRFNWGKEAQHSFSTGLQLYHVDSPRTDSRGATSNASSSVIRRASEREVFYLPVFAENKFTFGKFSITPGIRMENIRQEVREITNLDKVNPLSPLAQKDETRHLLLGGLGAEFQTDSASAIYANVSQSYRPQLFTEAVPLNNGQIVNGDLEEGKSTEYEVGYRSRPLDWLAFDTSVFLLSFKDQIGSVNQGGLTTFENVGDSVHKGIDVSANADLLRLFTGSEEKGKLDFYVNATYLNAEFIAGANDGKTPQYAPDTIFRTGLNYSFEDTLKVSLGATFLSDHFADDNNTANFEIPSYMVWDLTAEYKVMKNLRILTGINNVFDESYFSRVRPDGIDPGNGRNYYVGASLEF